MQETVLSQLKDKTAKLNRVVEHMKKEIESSNNQIATLRRDVSQNDIELSLIHDAYTHKYGHKSREELDQYFETIKICQESDIIRTNIEKAKIEFRELKAEESRLSGLCPSDENMSLDPNIDYDIQEMERELKSLRIQNQKIEKGVNLTKNKIFLANSEKEELLKALDEKRAKDKLLAEQRKEAAKLTKDISSLSDKIKEESNSLKEIQEKLASVTHETAAIDNILDTESSNTKNSLEELERIQSTRDQIEGYNKILRNYRSDYNDFIDTAPKLSEVIKKQITSINSFIDVIRAELEVSQQET